MPLSLAAGDPNPGNTPSCAPKKPVAARARKVVRPDAGPWDNPNFVWGLAHDIPATQRAPLLLVKHVAPPAVRVDNATYQNFWQLKLGEETFQLDLANLNWAEVPDEMRSAERISYREDPRFETLWNIDQTFFSILQNVTAWVSQVLVYPLRKHLIR